VDQEMLLIWLYCEVDDAVRSIVGTGRLRARGAAPELSDAEVLSIELFGAMMGLPSDAAIWRFARSWLRGWFPALGGEWNFVRRCANLCGIKQAVLGLLFRPGRWSAFDGLPLPVCQLVRAMRDRCFQGEAAKAFCAAKNEHYYGFKVHAMLNEHDEICGMVITAANVDERVPLEQLANGCCPLLFADKGLISKELCSLLAERAVTLVTPYRCNMVDERPPEQVRTAMRLRRRIETAFGQLVEHFAIDRTKGRDLWRWSARILRKILAYNLLVRFNAIAA
jgi:Transposase DDE domain